MSFELPVYLRLEIAPNIFLAATSGDVFKKDHVMFCLNNCTDDANEVFIVSAFNEINNIFTINLANTNRVADIFIIKNAATANILIKVAIHSETDDVCETSAAIAPEVLVNFMDTQFMKQSGTVPLIPFHIELSQWIQRFLTTSL